MAYSYLGGLSFLPGSDETPVDFVSPLEAGARQAKAKEEEQQAALAQKLARDEATKKRQQLKEMEDLQARMKFDRRYKREMGDAVAEEVFEVNLQSKYLRDQAHREAASLYDQIKKMVECNANILYTGEKYIQMAEDYGVLGDDEDVSNDSRASSDPSAAVPVVGGGAAAGTAAAPGADGKAKDAVDSAAVSAGEQPKPADAGGAHGDAAGGDKKGEDGAALVGAGVGIVNNGGADHGAGGAHDDHEGAGVHVDDHHADGGSPADPQAQAGDDAHPPPRTGADAGGAAAHEDAGSGGAIDNDGESMSTSHGKHTAWPDDLHPARIAYIHRRALLRPYVQRMRLHVSDDMLARVTRLAMHSYIGAVGLDVPAQPLPFNGAEVCDYDDLLPREEDEEEGGAKPLPYRGADGKPLPLYALEGKRFSYMDEVLGLERAAQAEAIATAKAAAQGTYQPEHPELLDANSPADEAATRAAEAQSVNVAAAKTSPAAGEDPSSGEHVAVAVTGGGGAAAGGAGKSKKRVLDPSRKENADLREALVHMASATAMLLLAELQQATLAYLCKHVGVEAKRTLAGLLAIDALYEHNRQVYNQCVAEQTAEAQRIAEAHAKATTVLQRAEAEVVKLVELKLRLRRKAGGNFQLGGYGGVMGGAGGGAASSMTPLAVARARAEALAVQPWTLALTVRRWHQPNDWSASDRRRLCIDWLSAIASWHQGTIKAGASPAASARETLPLGGASIGIPSFIGVEGVRPALLSSIDYLFADLVTMAGTGSPPSIPDDASTPIMTKSAIGSAVRSAASKVPYAIMALERRVRLTLLRIQTYEALFTTLRDAVAARKQMVRAHAAAGRKALSDAPIAGDIDLLEDEADVTGALKMKVAQALEEAKAKGMADHHELLFSLGVEDVPANGTMVALHNQAKLRHAATAFPHMLQALRELFPVGIIPDEVERLTRVVQLDQACRRHVHKKPIRKGFYAGLFPYGVDANAEPSGPGAGTVEDPALATVPHIPLPALNTRLPDDSEAATKLKAWDVVHCHGREAVTAEFKGKGCCTGPKAGDADNEAEGQAHIALVGVDLRVRTLLTCWSLEHARPFLVYSLVRCQGALLNMRGALPHGNARNVGDVVVLVRATQAGLAQSAAECHYRMQVVNNHKDESIPVTVVGGNRAVKPPVVVKTPPVSPGEGGDGDDDEGGAGAFGPAPPAPDLEATDAKAGLHRLAAQADALCELMLRRDVPLTYGGDGSSSIGQQIVSLNQSAGVPIVENAKKSTFVSVPPKWSHPFISAYAAFSNAADAVAFWRRRGHITPEGHQDDRPAPHANMEDKTIMRKIGKKGPDVAAIINTVHEQEATIEAVVADTPFMPKDAVRLTYRLLLSVPWVDGFAPSRDYSSVVLRDDTNKGLPLDLTKQIAELRSDALKTDLHLKPPAVTHELARGPHSDLAICTLGPEVQFLHDPTALAAVHTNYQEIAKPRALCESLGCTKTPLAVVQSIRQYFGESTALTYSVMQRMRTDLMLLSIVGIIRLAAGLAAIGTTQTLTLVNYVLAILTIIILSSCFESAWSRRRTLLGLLWGERQPTSEQVQARQVAAKAAEAARARASAIGGDPSREVMAAVTASGQMIGGPDGLPEEDRLIAAGSAYKPFYSRRAVVTQYFAVALFVIFQFGCFAGAAYAAWWVQDQHLAADASMKNILTPIIFCAGCAVGIVLGECLFEWTREWSPCTGQRVFRSIGTANPSSHGVWTALPAGLGASQIRRMYTRADEKHDFFRAFLVRCIPHFATSVYLAVMDSPLAGGKLAFPQTPFEAAGWQLFGLNVAQLLVELFYFVYAKGCTRRKRRVCCGNPCTALFSPCASRPSDHRVPWFLWYLKFPLVTKNGPSPIPSCNVDPAAPPNTDGVNSSLPPFMGVDRRGPWATPPLVGVDGVKRVLALFNTVRAKKELPALSALVPEDPNAVLKKEDIIKLAAADAMGKKKAAPPLVAVMVEPEPAVGGGAAAAVPAAAVVPAAQPAPAPVPLATAGTSSVTVGDPSVDGKLLFGVVGDNENGWMEVTAEKIVEARAAVGNAVQSRAALAQVFGHWWCMQVPGVDSKELQEARAKAEAAAKEAAAKKAAEEAEAEKKKKEAEEAAAAKKKEAEEAAAKKKAEEEAAKKKAAKGKKGEKKPGKGGGNKAGKDGKGKPGAGGANDEAAAPAPVVAAGGAGAEVKASPGPLNVGPAVQVVNVGEDKLVAAPSPAAQAQAQPAADQAPAHEAAAAHVGADKAPAVGPTGVPGPTHKPAVTVPAPIAVKQPAPALPAAPDMAAVEHALESHNDTKPAGTAAKQLGALNVDPAADAIVQAAMRNIGNKPNDEDDEDGHGANSTSSLYRYLLPQRDQPADEAALKYFNQATHLVDPNLFPVAMMASRASSIPLAHLPPYWEAQHHARILFIVANVLLGSLLQPIYLIASAPLMFYVMDNYVDMTQTQAVRRYPSRVLNDFFTRGYSILVYVSIFVAVVIMSRNPITLLDFDWNMSTFKAAEYVIAVLGAFVLASGARFCIKLALDRNMFCNRLCCGRQTADLIRVRNYLGYVEEELFDKASLKQAELINQHRVSGDRVLVAEMSSHHGATILKRMETISTDVSPVKAPAPEPQVAVNIPAPAPPAAEPAPAADGGEKDAGGEKDKKKSKVKFDENDGAGKIRSKSSKKAKA